MLFLFSWMPEYVTDSIVLGKSILIYLKVELEINSYTPM